MRRGRMLRAGVRFGCVFGLCLMLAGCPTRYVGDPVYKSITPDHVLCTVDCQDTDGAFGINSKIHHSFLIETEPGDKAAEDKAVKSVATIPPVSTSATGPVQGMASTALGSTGNAAALGLVAPYLPSPDVSVSTGTSLKK
jgi:hypothetical protein